MSWTAIVLRFRPQCPIGMAAGSVKFSQEKSGKIRECRRRRIIIIIFLVIFNTTSDSPFFCCLLKQIDVISHRRLFGCLSEDCRLGHQCQRYFNQTLTDNKRHSNDSQTCDTCWKLSLPFVLFKTTGKKEFFSLVEMRFFPIWILAARVIRSD